jgi:two-component system LytT family sensor kinase
MLLYLYKNFIYLTLHQFIFSNKAVHRISRHAAFWVVYCTYFYLQSLAPSKYDEFFISDTYYFAFLNLCCFAPVFISAVYFFIYFLLPKTLQKKKYALFVFGFLMVYSVGTLINYFMAGIFLNSVHYSVPVESNFQHRLEFGNYNTRWGMIIAIIALGIKLSKDWYLQQKGNLEILRKKIRTEMQLQKARIHPELLFRSLDAIYANIQSGFVNSTSMILNLSDLLSYSLYESETELVLLEKELLELHNLISLEQQNKNSFIEIQVQKEGETANKYIAPMVIVKLLEESITLLYKAGILSCLVSLQITVVNYLLSLKLSFIDLDENSSSIVKWPLLINNTQNRLSEYYSTTDYQIELVKEKKETIISLNLRLAGNPKVINAASSIKENAAAYDPA